MKLYFSPLACSLATRVALYEAGADVTFVEVDPKTKKTETGLDFTAIHPLGLVPLLELDDGELLSENAAILQYVAELHPGAGLAPRDPAGRARLQQWLGFIATELHKALFVPLLDPRAPAEARRYALSKEESRMGRVEEHLARREHLLDGFTVADAYLFTVLNWTAVTPVSLRKYPAVARWHAAIRRRPAVTRAYAEERTLYAKELARHAVSGAWSALFGVSAPAASAAPSGTR